MNSGCNRITILFKSLIGGGFFVYVILVSNAMLRLDIPIIVSDSKDLSWHNNFGTSISYPTTPNQKSNSKSPALRHIHVRPKIDHPPVYLAVPTVPREGNPLYLFRVLESLKWSGFPLDHVNVFFNGKPDQNRHILWEQSQMAYSSKGVKFMWNDAPLPDIHPSLMNSSIPLPDYIDPNESEMIDALSDSPSRREWRRKECYDFQLISRYMLDQVFDGVNLQDPVDVSRRNASWVIFNQDDAEWKKEFYHILHLLQDDSPKAHKNARYDLNPSGLVSVAFRVDILNQIVDYADKWCDFKPVDWVVWQFFRQNNWEAGKTPGSAGEFVQHIGSVSTRAGRVTDPVAPPVKVEKAGRTTYLTPPKQVVATDATQNQVVVTDTTQNQVVVTDTSENQVVVNNTSAS
jgi:hypothetical protein